MEKKKYANINEDEEFRPHSQSKSELAHRYFKDSNTKSAVRHLMRWIKKNKPLMEELKKKGYTSETQLFSTSQVRLIVEFLGEP